MKTSHNSKQPESSTLTSGKSKEFFFATKKSGYLPFFGPSNIQPKLEIGEPDDPYEKQADRVADAVVKSADASQIVQRQAAEDEELQMKTEPILQQKCKACEEKENLQKKENSSLQSTAETDYQISTKLQSKNGTSKNLPVPIQSEMSQKIGADFSDVSIHTDSGAADISQSLGARAFTNGKDIYFNSGEYNPSNTEGKHLLAHELTHVVQQGNAKNQIQREPLSDRERGAHLTNIITEMQTVHADMNDGAQDANSAISAAAQANADIAKAIFSISMAIIVPGFGGVISSFATRAGIAISSNVAERIGGVIGEAAKIEGENAINESYQSTEQNSLFVKIANGLEEAARQKREYLVANENNSAVVPDRDLVQLYNYWVALGRLDREDWSRWFQEKYHEYQQQIIPIGEQTDQRYGTNKLRWIEGDSWRGLALTGEGRLFMASGRPTFMSWISPFYREAAERRHEQYVGTASISPVHYTNLESSGSTTRSTFVNILDQPYTSYDNIIREQAQGNVQPGSGSTCPSCHGRGGGIGPDMYSEPIIDFEQFERNQPVDDVDTEALRRWIEAIQEEQ